MTFDPNSKQLQPCICPTGLDLFIRQTLISKHAHVLGNKISENEDVLQNIVCCWEIVLNSPNSVSPMSKLTHCNSLFQIPHLEYILINFQWVSLFAKHYTLNLTFNKSKNLTHCVISIIRKCFQNESIKYQFSGSSACTFTTKYIARIKCKCLFVIADTVAHNIDLMSIWLCCMCPIYIAILSFN